MISVPGCMWRRKPQLGRKNVGLFSTLRLKSKRRSVKSQACRGLSTYDYEYIAVVSSGWWFTRKPSNCHSACQTRDCRPMLFRGGRNWALIRGIIKSRPLLLYTYTVIVSITSFFHLCICSVSIPSNLSHKNIGGWNLNFYVDVSVYCVYFNCFFFGSLRLLAVFWTRIMMSILLSLYGSY
jgi:hypothetical protein